MGRLVLAGMVMCLCACNSTPRPDAGVVEAPLGCVPPLLIGHRGTPLFAPENTLEAFDYAVHNGGDGIEVDVRMTADGEPVVMHDATLDRTTDGHGPVNAHTLAEVQALDAGSWFDPRLAHVRVPSASDVLDAYGDTQQLILWDLKELAAAERLVDDVQERGLEARCVWSAWRLSILTYIRERLPDARTVLYTDALDDLEGLEPEDVSIVRVPKALEDDPDVAEKIARMGFGTAISGSFISWQTQDRALTEIGLVNNMAATYQRRIDRKPAECPEP